MSKDKLLTVDEAWEIFNKKRNKVDILMEAIQIMQGYNGQRVIDCIARAMGYEVQDN